MHVLGLYCGERRAQSVAAQMHAHLALGAGDLQLAYETTNTSIKFSLFSRENTSQLRVLSGSELHVAHLARVPDFLFVRFREELLFR